MTHISSDRGAVWSSKGRAILEQVSHGCCLSDAKTGAAECPLIVLAMSPLLRSNKAARPPGAQSQLGSDLCLTERFLTTDSPVSFDPGASQFSEALTKYPRQTTRKGGKFFGFTVSEVPVHGHLAPLFLAEPPHGRKRQLQNHDLVINFL